MRATRIVIPEKIAAAGKYISELKRIPLPEVYTGMLLLCFQTYDLTILPEGVQEALRTAGDTVLEDPVNPPPKPG